MYIFWCPSKLEHLFFALLNINLAPYQYLLCFLFLFFFLYLAGYFSYPSTLASPSRVIYPDLSCILVYAYVSWMHILRFFFLLLILSYVFTFFSFSLSFPRRSSVQGSLSRLFSRLPRYCTRLHFYRKNTPTLLPASTRIELHCYQYPPCILLHVLLSCTTVCSLFFCNMSVYLAPCCRSL